jgi:hypothetical protein
MATMNVYVSSDLKRRIDEVREEINWSAIAQKAFENALIEYQKRITAEIAERELKIYNRRLGLELAL